MHHNQTGTRYWRRLVAEHPDFQLALVDDGALVAELHSLPLAWDGTLDEPAAGLGRRVRAVVRERPAARLSRGARDLVLPERQGEGFAVRMVEAMRAAGRSHGLATVIAPVRPTWKAQLPADPDRALLGLAARRRLALRSVDPAPRARRRRDHRAGARVDARSKRRSRDWEEWTGMRFPEDGDYVVPGMLAPLADPGRDRRARRAERLAPPPALAGERRRARRADDDEPVALERARPPRRPSAAAPAATARSASARRWRNEPSNRRLLAQRLVARAARRAGRRRAGRPRSGERAPGRRSRRGRRAPARTLRRTARPCAPGRGGRWCRPAARRVRTRSCRRLRRCTRPTPGSSVRSSGQPCSATYVRGAVQVDGAAVVAEPLPLDDHLAERRGGERLDRRPALEPATPARDHALDLRLLQHHLADEDRVRIAGLPPREIPPVLAVPSQKCSFTASSLDGLCRDQQPASPPLQHHRTPPTARPPFARYYR